MIKVNIATINPRTTDEREIIDIIRSHLCNLKLDKFLESFAQIINPTIDSGILNSPNTYSGLPFCFVIKLINTLKNNTKKETIIDINNITKVYFSVLFFISIFSINYFTINSLIASFNSPSTFSSQPLTRSASKFFFERSKKA